MKKKGIELTVNFMVMFILAIVVFGFGIYFITKLFQGGQDIYEQHAGSMQSAVEKLRCEETDLICMNRYRTEIRRGESDFLAISIKNRRGQSVDLRFEITNIAAYDKSKALIAGGPPGGPNALTAAVLEKEKTNVQNGEDFNQGFIIQVPKQTTAGSGWPTGEYIFELRTEIDDPEDQGYKPYKTKQFIVEVTS